MDNSKADFYIVQLEPRVDPQRVKFGISKDVRKRMASYQTTHYSAVLLMAWRIDKSQEQTIIELLTDHVDCKHIAGEVYACSDIMALLIRARRKVLSNNELIFPNTTTSLKEKCEYLKNIRKLR